MIQSRAVLLSRLLSNHLKTKGLQKQQVCHSGSWNYRTGPDVSSYPAWVRYGSTGVAGLMWWWVLWHIWHEPEHITGEWPEPDPRLWTNKELGIPPDDEE